MGEPPGPRFECARTRKRNPASGETREEMEGKEKVFHLAPNLTKRKRNDPKNSSKRLQNERKRDRSVQAFLLATTRTKGMHKAQSAKKRAPQPNTQRTLVSRRDRIVAKRKRKSRKGAWPAQPKKGWGHPCKTAARRKKKIQNPTRQSNLQTRQTRLDENKGSLPKNEIIARHQTQAGQNARAAGQKETSTTKYLWTSKNTKRKNVTSRRRVTNPDLGRGGKKRLSGGEET